MTSSQRVVEFLRMYRGRWYCDRCIGESTAFESPSQLDQITLPLSLAADYERADSTHCNRCGEYCKCIRLRAHAA